jgi:hypothetical protein
VEVGDGVGGDGRVADFEVELPDRPPTLVLGVDQEIEDGALVGVAVARGPRMSLGLGAPDGSRRRRLA